MIPSALILSYASNPIQVRTPTSILTSFTFTGSGGANPANLYDRDDSTPAADPVGLNASSFVAYDFSAAYAVSSVRVITAAANGFANAGTFKVQYSDVSLSSGWTDTGVTFVIPAGTAQQVTAAVSAGAHRFWKITYVSGTTTGNAWLGGVDFSAPAAVTVPLVSTVSPSGGAPAGGTAMTITGFNLTGATGVTVGGNAATSFTVVSDNTITCTSPAHAAGATDVVVQHPSGDVTVTNGFTYYSAPTVTSISPNTGGAGTSVTITGTNFTGSTGATVGGVALTSFTVVSSTSITGVTGAHSPGAVNVVVTNPGGSGTLTNGFTYTNAVQTPTSVNTSFTYTGASPAANESKLYDGNDSTDAADPGGLTAATFASYDLGSAKNITSVRVVNSNRFTSSTPITYAIHYSDGSIVGTWVDSGVRVTMPATLSAVQTAAISAGSHRYWKLVYFSGTTGQNAWLGELQFLG